MSSFSKLVHLDASTKRNNTVDDQAGDPEVYLTGLRCTPLDPIADSVLDEITLQTPYRAVQTYVQGDSLDIKKGDVLVVSNVDYPIRFVSPWEWRKTKFVRLVLEDLAVN